MTKYILSGGNVLRYPERVKYFFELSLKDLGPQPKILWCLFASDLEEREERYTSHIKKTAPFCPNEVSPIHSHATEQDFEKQVNEADFITIQGGSTDLLKSALKPFNLNRVFDGKIVAGHSAGAHILASYFWSPGLRKFGTGFKILPIRTLTHFNSDFGSTDPRGPIDWEAAKAELTAYGNIEHEVVALEEGEFRVFEV